MKVGDRVRIKQKYRDEYGLEDQPAMIIEIVDRNIRRVRCTSRYGGQTILYFAARDLTLEPPNYGFGKWFKEHNHDR